MKRHFLVAVSCVLIGAGAVSAARPVAVGPRFPVSESPGARQLSSDVASGPLGQFVVTWQERAEPLGITRIAARRFDSGGNPVSGTFPVSDSAFSQHRPRVAVDASGNITIVWWSYERDGDGAGVFGQRFDRGGRRLGSEFQVNLTTAGTQYLGGIDAGDEGDFLVVWEDRRTSTGESHITVRRFEGSTGSFGPESVVGIGPAPFFWQSPDVALASDGGFQVVWTEYVIGSGGFEQLVWRRFDESAQPLGGEQAISIGDPSLYTSDVLPRIDIAPNDHSAVVWDRRLDRDTPVQVAGRRLDSSGPVSGDEIPFTEFFTLYAETPDLAFADDGSFIATWVVGDLLAERIDADGTSDGGPFIVDPRDGVHPAYTTPSIARLPSGTAVLTWARTSADLATGEIFARLYRDTCSVPGVDGLEVRHAPGGEVTLTWTDAVNAEDYVVFEDTSPDGAFTTSIGSVPTGATGLTLIPAGGTRFYLVAGRNAACGLGPRK